MSEELTPMNHRELWLQAIATGTVPEWLEPMTHEELWLKAIAQGGGGGGVLVVTDTDGTLDKTWQEIHDAPLAVLVIESDEYSKDCAMLSYIGRSGSAEAYSYIVTFGADATYDASSASGYPTLSE